MEQHEEWSSTQPAEVFPQPPPPSPENTPPPITNTPKRKTIAKFLSLGLIIAGLVILLVSQLLQDRDFFLKLKQLVEPNHKRVTVGLATDLSITAKQKTQAGVSQESSFILASQQSLDAKSITSSMTIVPKTDFDVSQLDDTHLEIKPKVKLARGEVYRFILASNNPQGNPQDLSWAFQIETPLKVQGSLPSDKATNVPPNSSIEVYFNQPDFTDADSHFAINPPTQGRFEKHQNALVFIPQSLHPLTLYTITLKKGISLADRSASIDTDMVFQFETGQDAKRPVNNFDFPRSILEVNPDKIPTIPLNNWEIPGGSKNTKIYRLPVSLYLSCLNRRLVVPSWSRYGSLMVNCDVSSLTPLWEFTADVKRASSYGQFYFDLPNTIEKGYYLLSIENEDGQTRSQQLIQSSALSWYSWYGTKQSALWINDLSTKKPTSAAVYLNDRVLSQTDSNGFARFETPPEIANRQPQLLKINSESANWYTVVNANRGNYSSWTTDSYDSAGKVASDGYWSFIYTDRQLYLPTDKVNFWGIIKHRETALAKISLRLYSNTINLWGDAPLANQPALAEKIINLSESNTFIDSFELRDISPGYYYLVAVDGETMVGYQSVEVQTFQKPSYKIALKPRKVAIWAGDSNTIDISVAFWDGTPVSNLLLTYSGGPANSGEVKTNLLGQAVIEIKSEYQENDNNYWPKSKVISIAPKLPEEGEIAGEVTYFTFGPNVETKTDSSWQNGEALIKLKATKVDLAEKAKEPWATSTQPVADFRYTVKIERTWSDKIANGEYYDPIEKIVQTTYRYEPRRELINTQELQTDKDGAAVIKFVTAENQSYEVTFTGRDYQNRLVSSTSYVYGSNFDNATSNNLTITGKKDSYQLGESGTLGIEFQGQPVPQGGDNRYLVIGTQLGKALSFDILSGGSWTFKFLPEFIPNLWFTAVWFDGSRYRLTQKGWQNNGANIIYDSQGKEITIATALNKVKYQPGEEALIDLKATNNGNPVANARVLISGVDEALTDIDGISSQSLLGGLYKIVSDGRVYSYTTHPDLKLTGAEGGGGGGDRTKFENTAVFSELITNQNGEAKVRFKLPDNITTWRLTVLVVSKDLLAGETAILLPVTKPLFVNLITADEFVTADKPVVRAIAYGESLIADQPIAYHFSSKDLAVGVTNQEKSAYIPAETSIGLNDPGNKEIKVTAKQNTYDDTLTRKITILQSRSGLAKSEYVNLSSPYQPTFQSFRNATFIVTDYGLAAWYQKLTALTQQVIYKNNDRVDRIASQIRAKEILRDRFGEKVDISESIDGFQNQGGYSLLRYGEADLLTSVKISALHLNRSNKLALTLALWRFFNQERSIENASLALWGLAEAGESVLTTVQNLAVQDNTDLGKLYLALGATALGDQGFGREVYRQMVEKYAQKEGQLIYLAIGDTKESYIQATTLTMILGTKLGQNEVEMMWNYLDQNISEETLYSLEKIIAIQSFIDSAPADKSSFEYSLEGKSKTVSLDGSSWRIDVPGGLLNSFSLKPVSGKVSVASLWYEMGKESVGKVEPGLGLLATLNPGLTVSLDSVVEMKIKPAVDAKLQNGNYLVEVLLPSGLRYVNAPYRTMSSEGDNWHYSWPVIRDGNRLVFWADTVFGIRFLARPINKGEFVFEPIKIYNQNAPESYNQFSLGQKLVVE